MSSTAVELAMLAMPGRVTVHIWSSVRSLKDCDARDVNSRGAEKSSGWPTHIHRRNDVVAVVAAELASVGCAGHDLRGRRSFRVVRWKPVPHDEESVESEGDVHYELHSNYW